MSKAWLIAHVDGHVGCTWTDPLGIFTDKAQAEDYLSRLREREGCDVDDDGWTDSTWHIMELPVLISYDELPERINYRWVLV